MKHFNLYPTVKFVKTSKNSCIYDFVNGKMIKLNEASSNILENCQKNIPVKEDTDNKFLDILQDMGLGSYRDKMSYEESFENTISNIKSEIVPYNNIIDRVFIELGSKCNFDCVFCNTDNKLYRKTGCKRWESYEAELDLKEWGIILNDLSYLKSKKLCFIGGNPLLRFDYIKEIIKESKKYGFEYFLIYTNGSLINDEIIQFLKEYNVTLNIQILSFNENTLNKIGKNTIDLKSIENNLMQLRKMNVNFISEILINRYNEDEIEEIKAILNEKYKIKSIKLGYIYKKPYNNHFSQKYVNDMYNKFNTFPKVTPERFNFLQMWNSCLKGQCTIKENGDVLICPMLRSDVIGNVKKNSITEIINTKKYREYENITKNSIEKCKECSYKFNCSDCRAIEISATNDLYGLEYCSIEE